MTIETPARGGIEKLLPVSLTTANKTAVATGFLGAQRMVVGLHLADYGGTGRLAKVFYYEASTTTEHGPIWIGTVAANTTEKITDLPVRLYENDELRVQYAAANECIVTPIIISSTPDEPGSNPQHHPTGSGQALGQGGPFVPQGPRSRLT